MTNEQLTFAALTGTLKAAGEETRLRILALLAEAELTVSDLTDILRQSQPRLSRHLRLLAEAGPGRALPRGLVGVLPAGRARRRRRHRPRLIARLDPGDPTIAPRPRTPGRGALGARRGGAELFPARTPPNGTASASCTSPTPPLKTPSARRSPTSRSARCSISAPAPGACSNCSPAISSAASASICRSTCWRSRASGSIAPA